jgi:hypothetical protein
LLLILFLILIVWGGHSCPLAFDLAVDFVFDFAVDLALLLNLNSAQ